MMDRRLFIFIEGNDDERFFKRIVRPLLESRYQSIELIMYACMKSVRVCRFIKGISSMGHDFILVADIDQEPGVKAKKKAIRNRFCNVDEADIVVIIEEIESWYLAGVDDRSARKLGIRPPRNTDRTTKEDFNRKIPRHYTSRVAYLIDILDVFSINIAKEKNRSFRYFVSKYMIQNQEQPTTVRNAVSAGVRDEIGHKSD
ncbi:MAG TPA: hypothetical protein VMW63_09800 [Methanoregulaceae archaeon]|nr:hypothetical protein [Methanoregulaceae archaeon]